MADKAKAYRDTRTNAIRRSTSELGYPYVPVSEAEVKRLADNPQADPSAMAITSTDTADQGKGK